MVRQIVRRAFTEEQINAKTINTKLGLPVLTETLTDLSGFQDCIADCFNQ